MKRKSDTELKSLRYIKDIFLSHIPSITNIHIPEYEDGGWDIYFTATTVLTAAYGIEVKRCKGTYCPERYAARNEKQNVRYDICSAYTQSAYTQEEILNMTTTSIPDDVKGKQFYMLNASSNYPNGLQVVSEDISYKWSDICSSPIKDNRKIYVIYLWENAMIVFNPFNLKDAFLGYYWIDTDLVNQSDARWVKEGTAWQRRTMIDLTKGQLYTIKMDDKTKYAIYGSLDKNKIHNKRN